MTDAAPALTLVPPHPGPRLVAVADLRPGDRLILPSGQRVTVEAVGTNDDGTMSVRWWRDARRGEPGFRNPDQPRGDHNNGRYLGSLAATVPDTLWKVE